MIITKRAALVILLVTGVVFFVAGVYIGVKCISPSLTQHHYVTTIEKPTIVQGEIKTITDTQIAYVPKETVITKYVDASGKEVTGTALEKTDLDASAAKDDFNVRLNGKDVQFTKADNEKYLFEKNKIALNQTSKITFDATVSPTVIDNTKRWSAGVGYGTNGWAGKIDFPIKKSDTIGGWVYGDNKVKTAGLEVKF